MNYLILSNEITNDPLSRNYAAMNDIEVAASLNTENRTVNKTTMSGDEVFQATDSAEWGLLLEPAKSQWLAFCGRDSIDPYGAANVAFVQTVFGGGSATVTNLQALRVQTVSRAAELGLGTVTENNVFKARGE